MNEQLKEAIRDAIHDALGGALDCNRVWSAWSAGTMSEDDFSQVADDPSRVEEITDAVVAALSAQPSPGGQGDAPEIEQLRALVSSILSTVSLGHQKGPYAYAGEDFGRYLAEAARDCRTILRGLSDIAARQPVGEPVAVRVTPEMRAAFRRAFREGGFWNDRLDTALDAMMRAAPPAQAVDLGQLPPRWVVEFWHRFGHREYADRLLALIDSQAVGK